MHLAVRGELFELTDPLENAQKDMVALKLALFEQDAGASGGVASRVGAMLADRLLRARPNLSVLDHGSAMLTQRGRPEQEGDDPARRARAGVRPAVLGDQSVATPQPIEAVWDEAMRMSAMESVSLPGVASAKGRRIDR